MITRRDAVISSAGLLGAALLAPVSALSAVPDGVIGLDESFMFPRWRTAMAEVLGAGRIESCDLGLRKALSSACADDTFAMGGRNAAGLRVVSLAAPGVSRLPHDHAADFAMMANDALAQAVSTSSGRMIGLATVSLRHPDAAAAEADRAVSKLGFRGIVLQPHESGLLIDDARFAPLFETIAGLKVPVLFQSSAPADAALPLIRMMFGGSFDRWPDLQVIVSLGEAGAYWAHKMAVIHGNLQADRDPLPDRRPRDYLASNVLTTTAGMQSLATLRAAYDIFGERSVLLSVTDETHAQAIKSLAASRLADPQRRSLHRDAAGLAFFAADNRFNSRL